MGMYVYKMFDKGLKCRNYQFKVGLNICEHATCVKEGFHAAYNPLDCLSYYPCFEKSECWLCYADGEVHENGSDTKISCTRLEVLKQLTLSEFVYEAVRYIIEHPKRPLHSLVSSKAGIANTDINHFKIAAGDNPKVKATCNGDVVALLVASRNGEGFEKLVFIHGDEVKAKVVYEARRDIYDEQS